MTQAATLTEASTHSNQPYRRLWVYAKRRRGSIIRAIIYAILNKLFDLAPPVLIGAAVDIVVERESSFIANFVATLTKWFNLDADAFGVPNLELHFIFLASITVLIWVLESFFEYLSAIEWRGLAQSIEHDLRTDAFEHVLKLDMAYFHFKSTGGLMALLNDDINQLERFLDSGAESLIQILTTAVLVSAAFFFLAPSVAWLAMLPIPFVLFGSFRFQSLLAPRYLKVRESVDALNGHLGNNLRGIATIKSFASEEIENLRVRELSKDYRERNREAIKFSSAFAPLIRIVIVCGFVATLVVGGHLAIEGEIAVGTYSVLVFLTQRLLWPLTRLGRTFDEYQRAGASTNRVLDLLETKVEIVSGSHAPHRVVGRIAFKHVTFGYRPNETILEKMNLTIEPGETIGVVGSTGAGKTTIINLLLRYYDVTSGHVEVDGVSIPEWNLNSLRRSIGLVSQRTYLFSGTVKENLSYGLQETSQADIEHAAGLAGIHDYINGLPLGYETRIGERGETLSGGQAQRIAIARAILKDPPILILDEATSAVDNETEAAIQRSIESITTNRTTIIIAHRLSTVRNADRIIVLADGGISEVGTHTELLEQGARYASLWSVQTGQLQT